MRWLSKYLECAVQDGRFRDGVVRLSVFFGEHSVLVGQLLLELLDLVGKLDVALRDRLITHPGTLVTDGHSLSFPKSEETLHLSFGAHEEPLLDLLGIVAIADGLQFQLLLLGLNAIDLRY